jgi:histidinol-phosphate aminotransferase
MIRPPRARAVLDSIPAYAPGRSAAAAVDASGAPVAAAVKLSSNEVPYPTDPDVVAAVTAAAETLNRYPDTASTDLVAALARRHDVDPAQIVATTGSVAALYHLLAAFCEPGDEVVYAWRSFEAYPIATLVPGATAVTVALDGDFRHDVDAMAAAVTERTKVVLVCTPNNPTGPAVTADELARLVAAVPAHVVIVVDEAYGEFVADMSKADGLTLLPEHRNIVVLRTLSKAWGLAGARVGYLVADPEVASAVRKVSLPFAVNTLAQVAALASLADEDGMRARVANVVAERDRVLPAVRALGFTVPDSQANFFWLPAVDDAAELAAHLDAGGVIVRPFAGSGVRVTIGLPAENDRVLEALASWPLPAT